MITWKLREASVKRGKARFSLYLGAEPPHPRACGRPTFVTLVWDEDARHCAGFRLGRALWYFFFLVIGGSAPTPPCLRQAHYLTADCHRNGDQPITASSWTPMSPLVVPTVALSLTSFPTEDKWPLRKIYFSRSYMVFFATEKTAFFSPIFHLSLQRSAIPYF